MGSALRPEQTDTGERQLYVVIVVVLAALATATYFAVRIDVFGWDVDITRWVQGFSLGEARFLRGWLFWMGVKGVAGVVLVVMLYVFWSRRRRIEAVFLVLVGVPDAFNVALREIIGRPRPTLELVEVFGGPQGYSFPSGHALHVTLFYGLLLYLAGRYISSRRIVYSLRAVGIIYILVTGLWLIYAGRHWFTDVMGGYIYGVMYLLLFIAGFRATVRWMADERSLELPNRLPRPLRGPVRYGLRILI